MTSGIDIGGDLALQIIGNRTTAVPIRRGRYQLCKAEDCVPFARLQRGVNVA